MQKVLYTERNAGTRERVHDHYLKGTIWCARCRRRLILRPSTSKTGQVYFYYICRGVQEADCDLPALPLHKVEHAVTQHYSQISISERHRKALESLAVSAADDSQQTTAKIRASLGKQLTELDRQENRFLDLIGDPEWPQDKIKTRMQTVRESKQRITQQLDGTIDDLEPGRAVLHAALELLDRPRDLYDAATDEARKMLNKSIFTRLYLDSTDRRPTTTTATLSEPFASLVHAARAAEDSRTPQTLTTTHNAADTPNHLSGLLTIALAGQSGSKAAMVEVLAAYSHSAQAVDLRLATPRFTNPLCASRPSAKRPGSLHDRLDERDITDLIPAYRDGATAPSLTAALGLSLKSVKHLLHIAGVRRTSPTRRATKPTPTATHR